MKKSRRGCTLTKEGREIAQGLRDKRQGSTEILEGLLPGPDFGALPDTLLQEIFHLLSQEDLRDAARFSICSKRLTSVFRSLPCLKTSPTAVKAGGQFGKAVASMLTKATNLRSFEVRLDTFLYVYFWLHRVQHSLHTLEVKNHRTYMSSASAEFAAKYVYLLMVLKELRYLNLDNIFIGRLPAHSSHKLTSLSLSNSCPSAAFLLDMLRNLPCLKALSVSSRRSVNQPGVSYEEVIIRHSSLEWLQLIFVYSQDIAIMEVPALKHLCLGSCGRVYLELPRHLQSACIENPCYFFISEGGREPREKYWAATHRLSPIVEAGLRLPDEGRNDGVGGPRLPQPPMQRITLHLPVNVSPASNVEALFADTSCLEYLNMRNLDVWHWGPLGPFPRLKELELSLAGSVLEMFASQSFPILAKLLIRIKPLERLENNRIKAFRGLLAAPQLRQTTFVVSRQNNAALPVWFLQWSARINVRYPQVLVHFEEEQHSCRLMHPV